MQDTDFEKQSDSVLSPNTASQLDAVVPKSDEFVIKDIKGEVHTFKKETFPVYKTAEVLKMLASVKEDIDLVELITEVQTLVRPNTTDEDVNVQGARKLNAALQAIPKLISVAPDLLLDFSALALIPNAQLLEAAESQTLREVRAQNRRMLEFKFGANAPIEIFAAYLPYLGVDFLAKALTSLNLSVAQTVNQLSQV
jgi:hypothetical protein